MWRAKEGLIPVENGTFEINNNNNNLDVFHFGCIWNNMVLHDKLTFFKIQQSLTFKEHLKFHRKPLHINHLYVFKLSQSKN